MRKPVGFFIFAAAITASTSAFAAPTIAGPVGTVSSVALFNPTVTLNGNTSTYSATGGQTFQISGTGTFSNVAATLGSLNGTLTFSQMVNALLPQTVNNFFTFSDAAGGNFGYSVSSVRTQSFVNAGGNTSGTLFLLGTITDPNRGFNGQTPASLSVQFNRTGASSYSSALTLASPATAGAVPEVATWAMMILGFGVIGFGLRYRTRSTKVSFA